MNKKIKILTSLSLSLVSLPLIAASCKKKIETRKDNSNKDNKNENSSTHTETIDNESNNNSSMPNESERENIQGDQTRAENQISPKAPEDSGSSSSNSNSGNYSTNNHSSNGIQSIEEAEKNRNEKELEQVKKVKEIVKTHKDAFGSFHTQGEFLDQIAVYANDEGISGLKLQNEDNKNTKLNVDEDGQGNKNTIELKLGSQNFQVSLGIVLNDAVITKYYIKGKKEKILDNYFTTNTKDQTINKNWGYDMKDHEVVITQLGYHHDNYSGIKLTQVGKKTIEVPRHLPLKINSLDWSFLTIESEKIENLEMWDVKNIKKAEGAFSDAKNFSQDLSNWKLNIKGDWRIKGMFKGSPKMNEFLKKMAAAWKVKENILSK